MNKILLFGALLFSSMLFVGCKSEQMQGKCVINGIANANLNGKKIFLVPMTGPQDAEHVDSTIVKDGEFHFEKDSTELAVIRMDYHFRSGTEELLVVTEPGNVKAAVDSISDCSGTTQNDSLSKWKNITEKYNRSFGMLRYKARISQSKGDSAAFNELQNEANSVHKQYKEITRQIGNNLKSGVLHDFLLSLFPTSYKKRMPDGSIVVVKDE